MAACTVIGKQRKMRYDMRLNRKCKCSKINCERRNVRLVLKNFYNAIGITDDDEIKEKIQAANRFIMDSEIETYQVGNRLIKGRKTPIAMIHDIHENRPTIKYGRPYLRNMGDWVVLR